MTYQVFYSPGAEADVKEIVDWYSAKSIIAAANFLIELKPAENRIGLRPRAFRKSILGFRRIVIPRFPYAAYFRESGNQVIVLAVIHFGRSKRHLKNRLGN